MKKTIILLVILGMSLGLFAQRVQQQNTKIKPKKQVKVNYEARYYEVMKTNDTLQIDNGRKDTKIYKILDELKTKNNEISRLQQGNAKLNQDKNSLSAEVQRMKMQIAKLKAGGDLSKIKAEIKSLRAENVNLRVSISNSSKWKIEIESLRTENAKLKAALNGSKTKTKGKVIKVQRQ